LKDIGADSASHNIISDFNITNLEKFYDRISKESDEFNELFFPRQRESARKRDSDRKKELIKL